MAAGEWNSYLGTDSASSSDDKSCDLRGQFINRPAENGNRHEGASTHGIDVADGVGGGNAAKIEGVIDDGHEKVGGAQYGSTVAHIKRSGIVATAVTHEELGELRSVSRCQTTCQHFV